MKKKVKVFTVDNAGKSQLLFVFGFDEIEKKVRVLFRKSSADPSSLLQHNFQGKDGLFSAKDGEIFIEQLPAALSYNQRIWAKIA